MSAPQMDGPVPEDMEAVFKILRVIPMTPIYPRPAPPDMDAEPRDPEKEARTLIATAALLKAPVYRLQPPGPMFLACFAGGTRELADLAALRAFVEQIRGRRA